MLQYFAQNKIQTHLPYEPNDFLFRWKKIERIVSKQNVDGLLLIAGADSNNNEQTTKLLNWLFLGYSGQLIAKNSYLPQNLQEVIIFISKNSNIFLHPKGRKQLSQYVYCIPTMDVFSPSQQQFQNKQTLDVLKISEFYKMVKDHKKIGVMSDSKLIQKWPLIQSFALEQVGGAFFSMKYQIQNLASKIQSVYKNHDKHSLKSLYQITSKRMLGYLIGTTSVLQNTEVQKRSLITENQLNQPINQSIQIQQIQQSGDALKQIQQSTSILVGERTNNIANKSNQTQIGNNLHMTIDYSDPNTLLRVCRTYFLSNGAKLFEELVQQDIPQPDTFIVDKVYNIKRTVNKEYKDQYVLLTLYSNLIESTLQAIVGVIKDYRNLNSEYVKSVITTKLSTILKDLFAFFPLINIEAELFSYNSLGQLQKVDFKDIISFKLTPHYYIIKTSIKDIPSPQNQKKILGSVIFSESFILQQGCYMLLTKNIPYFDIYNCHQKSTIYKNLNPNIRFQQLGNMLHNKGINDCKLMVLTKPQMNIKSVNIPLFDITLHFHQKGLRVYSEKLGWLIIPSDYLKQITLINNIDGYWVQIELLDQLILSDYSSNQIILGLAPKAQELFQTTIVDKLKQKISFNEINETPQHLAENDYFLRSVLRQKDLGLLTHSQVVNSQFLFSYLEAKQLMILNGMRDLKLSAFRSIYNKPDGALDQKELSKPKILVINGTYGSGKNRFATNLLRYTRQNRFDSSIFTISHENLPSKLELVTFMSMLDEFIAQKPKKASNLTFVVVPCWINSKQFLQAASSKYHIRSVCTKINASNFYSTLNYQLTDNTLTYATPGFNQLVFIDTYGQDESYISEINSTVWNYSPDSKVYTIQNNSITSGVARDVYNSDKYMKQSQIFLRSKYLALYELRLDFELRYVEIRIPIRTKDAIQRLKQQDGYLYSLKLVQKQLQRQRIQAQTTKDQLLETLYKIKRRITLQKRKGLAMRLKWLKGNLKFIDQKQAQQLTWTTLFYRQKPNKTAVVLGLSILSNKWNEHEFQQFIDDLSQKGEFFKKIKQHVTLQSLTLQQIKGIERQNRDKYLENGQFFDGHFFRDCEGNILKTHPKLNELLKQYIQSQNLTRAEFNKSVTQQWQTYKNSFKK